MARGEERGRDEKVGEARALERPREHGKAGRQERWQKARSYACEVAVECLGSDVCIHDLSCGCSGHASTVNGEMLTAALGLQPTIAAKGSLLLGAVCGQVRRSRAACAYACVRSEDKEVRCGCVAFARHLWRPKTWLSQHLLRQHFRAHFRFQLHYKSSSNSCTRASEISSGESRLLSSSSASTCIRSCDKWCSAGCARSTSSTRSSRSKSASWSAPTLNCANWPSWFNCWFNRCFKCWFNCWFKWWVSRRASGSGLSMSGEGMRSSWSCGSAASARRSTTCCAITSYGPMSKVVLKEMRAPTSLPARRADAKPRLPTSRCPCAAFRTFPKCFAESAFETRLGKREARAASTDEARESALEPTLRLANSSVSSLVCMCVSNASEDDVSPSRFLKMESIMAETTSSAPSLADHGRARPRPTPPRSRATAVGAVGSESALLPPTEPLPDPPSLTVYVAVYVVVYDEAGNGRRC
mmetsp:Transcript_29628/g.64821  ORF Transcript_29628/g.64821 Transcript_29628/m.64821 type:complete len:471 (+) Transcript_29628:287-1699(+)